MRRIVWLNSAVDDLVRLRNFLEKENPDAVVRATKSIQIASTSLSQHAYLGKPVKDLEHYRDLLIRFGNGGYILRYRVDEQAIHVVHLRHYREQDF